MGTGASLARRVLALVNAELDKMSPTDRNCGPRSTMVRRKSTNGNRTGAPPNSVGDRRVVAHETIQAWMWDIWAVASRLEAT